MSLKLTIPRSELKEAVGGFGKVINGKSTLPVLAAVRFDAGKSGAAAQATDLDQVVDYRFAHATVDGEGACILPLTTVKDLAKGIKNEQVEIEANDGSVALTNHVGGHALKQSINGIDPEEWPTMNTDIQTKPAEGFIETYRRLVPFSSTDETRHVINSVFVEIGKGKDNPATLVSTDGRRLCLWNNMALPINKSIVVPTTKFLSWSRLPGGIQIGVREGDGQSWLGVQAGPFRYSVKAIDGTYPNFRQVIPTETGEHIIKFSDADVELLKQVLPTFPGEEEVTFVGCKGTVTVYGRGPSDERSTSLKLENTTYVGDRAFIGLNRRYLLDSLKAGFREFAIADAHSPVLSRDGNGGMSLIMPVGVQDPEETGESAKSPAVDAVAMEEKPAESQVKGAPVTEPATTAKKPMKRREKKVTKQDSQKHDPSALDRVLTACDAARTKVKESGQALTELTLAIKEAARDQKVQAKEVESARAALAKLQAINL